MARAVSQQHVGEAPGGGPQVHGHHARGIVMKHLQRLFQLQPAPGHVGMGRPPHGELIIRLHRLGGLGHLFLSDVHQPRHDERLRLLAAFGQAALHQRHVGALFFRLVHGHVSFDVF